MSDNGGIDWQALGTPSESSVDFNLFKIYLDPADAQILYANVYTANRDNSSAYPNRIAKSYDAGSTWQVIDVSPYQPGKIVVNAQNNQQLLMTSGQGVLRSENGGLDWEPSNKGIYAIGGRLSVASNDSDVMYLVQGGYKGRKYKSMDAGQHWQELSRGEISDSCYAIHINPIHNQEIICQSSSGLYRSFDAGVHWEIFSNVANTGLVYAQDGKTIYIYNRGEISKSINNGQSWKKNYPY